MGEFEAIGAPSSRQVIIGSLMTLALLVLSVMALAQARDYTHSPVRGAMSSGFGWRQDPLTGQRRFHAGVDIAAEAGAPIHVPQNGLVVYSGFYKGYGNVVVVQHHPDLYTLYGHTAQSLVHTGEPVSRGQVIALVGSSGRSTGPHLHFEVRQNNGFVNPLEYLAYLENASLPTVANLPPQAALVVYPRALPSPPASLGPTTPMGGPEIPVARHAGGQYPGNAIQAQYYRHRPGRTMQVISGSQVRVVQF